MWSIDTESGMETAKTWTRALLASINEGGIWGVPRAYTAYQFWPEKKEYRWAFGAGDTAIEAILKELGYTRRTP